MLKKITSKYIFIFALTLFLLSASIGLLMRWNSIFPFKVIPYKNLLQGHSHVAFLGWGYLALISAIIKVFISKEKRENYTYSITLLIILVCVSFMLISFPLVGYSTFSIVLLSIFGVSSYILSFKILKDINKVGISSLLIKYGIYYYLISSVATWFFPIIIVFIGKTSLYYNAIYFYMHFLYNGFFVFGLFGLLFKLLENEQIKISDNYLKQFFLYLNIACVPAYILSVLWSGVPIIFNIIGFIASLLQFISLLFLLKILKQVYYKLKWNFILKVLLVFSITAYILKIISQILSSFPYFVQKSLALKPFFIIGYLHLFTLAFMSVFLFLILNKVGEIKLNSKLAKAGVYVFLAGVLITEIVLFLQGFLILVGFTIINNYTYLLLIFSFIILAGILMVFISQYLKPKTF